MSLQFLTTCARVASSFRQLCQRFRSFFSRAGWLPHWIIRWINRFASFSSFLHRFVLSTSSERSGTLVASYVCVIIDKSVIKSYWRACGTRHRLQCLLKAQLIVLVSAFVMVNTVWSVSCLLSFYLRCLPPCPAICKSGGHVCPLCPVESVSLVVMPRLFIQNKPYPYVLI